MDVSSFVRTYYARSPNIMWFLGAGASASAGVPTAWDLTWEFKRSIFCSEEKVPVSMCSDLGNPTVRSRIQYHFDQVKGFPSDGSDDEYSFYFERAYPADSDRRRYLDSLLRGKTPSHGHFCLAILMAIDKCRLICTTNFDRLPEDALASVSGTTSSLTVSSLETCDSAIEALNEGRWPLMLKLHGDFHSTKLKNTTIELRSQDHTLRKALVESCKRFGLAVTGYSGRDHSVMDSLEEGLHDGDGYPFGLFWFVRPGSPPFQRVVDLVNKAKSLGIEAYIIDVPTFDELMSDLMLLIDNDVPSQFKSHLQSRSRRLTQVQLVKCSNSGWPVLRFNSIPILSGPSLCRLVDCRIGGTKEVREMIARTGNKVVAVRSNIGVLAFGSDSEIRDTFKNRSISRFDVHSIDSSALHEKSAELGLLYDAVKMALVRELPLRSDRRGGSHVVAIEKGQDSSGLFDCLREEVKTISGIVSGTQLAWSECVKIKVEKRFDRLWLLLEPSILVDRTTDDHEYGIAKEFIRRRLSGRFNKNWNGLLIAWTRIITRDQDSTKIRALGISDGIDATFELCGKTSFSRPEKNHGR